MYKENMLTGNGLPETLVMTWAPIFSFFQPTQQINKLKQIYEKKGLHALMEEIKCVENMLTMQLLPKKHT